MRASQLSWTLTVRCYQLLNRTLVPIIRLSTLLERNLMKKKLRMESQSLRNTEQMLSLWLKSLENQSLGWSSLGRGVFERKELTRSKTKYSTAICSMKASHSLQVWISCATQSKIRLSESIRVLCSSSLISVKESLIRAFQPTNKERLRIMSQPS